jgi:hypothetical protein
MKSARGDTGGKGTRKGEQKDRRREWDSGKQNDWTENCTANVEQHEMDS